MKSDSVNVKVFLDLYLQSISDTENIKELKIFGSEEDNENI